MQMDRRTFLKATTCVAAASIAKNAHASASSAISAGHAILPMNRGWRFSRSADAGMHSPAFDDSSLERVIVPHTNVALPWHGFDDKEYEFISAYRRKLHIPLPPKERESSLTSKA